MAGGGGDGALGGGADGVAGGGDCEEGVGGVDAGGERGTALGGDDGGEVEVSGGGDEACGGGAVVDGGDWGALLLELDGVGGGGEIVAEAGDGDVADISSAIKTYSDTEYLKLSCQIYILRKPNW